MNHKLRITFIIPYAGMSGGIRVIAIYAARLKARGHKVRVISTPWVPTGRLARVRYRVVNWLRENLRQEHEPAPSHFDGVDVDHVQIKQNRPITDDDVPDGDVVVATWWETAPWVANFSESKGAKAYFVQDYGAHEGQPMDRVAETWSLPLHKMAISKWLLRLIEEHTGDRDVDYIPNAVDLRQFSSPPRGKQPQPTVGFLYNPVPQKGCDTIIAAIERVQRRYPQLRVLAFGPGDPQRQIPLPAGTEFLSYVPDDKLKEVYGSCDAWLFGSRSEGFGLPILEAMACRTPVIGTPAGAAPDLLCEGGGMLVKADDPADMAAAIERIVQCSDAQWRAISEAALATAQRFTWEDATDLFEAGLMNAVERAQLARVGTPV